MKRIGVITALIREAACLTTTPPAPGRLSAISNHVSLCICGMGAERAYNAAVEMASSGIEVLISWGTAGALTADMKPGDLLIPAHILRDENHNYRLSASHRQSLLKQLNECPADIYLGTLADTTQVLTGTLAKSDHHRHHQALAVDMESAAIAAAAEKYRLPCIAIRAISDSSSMHIPDVILRISDQYGRVRIGGLLGALSRHPGSIIPLLRLAAGYRAAAASLSWIGRRHEQILQQL